MDLIFFAHTRVQREDRAWSTSKRLVPAAVGCACTVYARVFTSPVPRSDVHAESKDAQVSRCLHINGTQWLSERTACAHVPHERVHEWLHQNTPKILRIYQGTEERKIGVHLETVGAFCRCVGVYCLCTEWVCRIVCLCVYFSRSTVGLKRRKQGPPSQSVSPLKRYVVVYRTYSVCACSARACA